MICRQTLHGLLSDHTWFAVRPCMACRVQISTRTLRDVTAEYSLGQVLGYLDGSDYTLGQGLGHLDGSDYTLGQGLRYLDGSDHVEGLGVAEEEAMAAWRVSECKRERERGRGRSEREIERERQGEERGEEGGGWGPQPA